MCSVLFIFTILFTDVSSQVLLTKCSMDTMNTFDSEMGGDPIPKKPRLFEVQNVLPNVNDPGK